MESFEYTITTDAFTLGGIDYSAQTLTFTRALGQNDVSLAGMVFDGIPLTNAHFYLGGWPFGYQALSIFTAGQPGQLGGISAAGDMHPTFLAPVSTALQPIFAAGMFEVGSGHYFTRVEDIYIGGTLTEKALNLPEPSTFIMLFFGLIGILVAQSIAPRHLQWRIQRRTTRAVGVGCN